MSPWAPETFVSPREVAETFRVDVKTIYRAIVKGALPTVRVGRACRVRASDVYVFVGYHDPSRSLPSSPR